MHNCRQSPGLGSAMWRTWNSRSKSRSSTQYGWSRFRGTATIFWRNVRARWMRSWKLARMPLNVTAPPGAVDGS